MRYCSNGTCSQRATACEHPAQPLNTHSCTDHTIPNHWHWQLAYGSLSLSECDPDAAVTAQQAAPRGFIRLGDTPKHARIFLPLRSKRPSLKLHFVTDCLT